MSDVAAWVSAGCAAASIIGATFAWWRSNLSRKARTEAVSARDQAARSLVAAEQQAAAAAAAAEATERLAKHAEGPEFWLERFGDSALNLHTRLSEATINGLEVAEHSAFAMRGLPVTITPGRPARMYHAPSLASPDEPAVGLRVDGRDAIVWVPLPPGME